MVQFLLKQLPLLAPDGWELTHSTLKGWEFYFIGHQLDQNRAKQVETISVKVYKRQGDQMGSATGEIAPTATTAEAIAKVQTLLEQAAQVRNAVFQMRTPKEAQPFDGKEVSLTEDADAFLTAIRSVREEADADINSYEVFVSRVTKRLVTSTGIDVTETYPTSMAEVVVNARDENHEIELYRMIRGGNCDQNGLKQELENTLQVGKDRLVATATPVMDGVPVLFSTEAGADLYWYFLRQSDLTFVYRSLSAFEKEKPIVTDWTGDAISIKALRYLPNSSSNRQYDSEGAPIEDRTLVEAFVPKAFWGNAMYSSYMDEEGTFQISNWEATGGTATEAELREGSYLEVVEFSDFQVDGLTGDIFGEIRLGYYHHDGVVDRVTGGSVSGNVRDNFSTWKMSAEQVQYNNVRIPKLTKLSKVTISGVSEQ